MITLKTIPPAMNATYKSGNGRFYKSSEAKAAQEAMAWEAKAQWMPKKPITGKISITIRFIFKDARRDIDSGVKATLDALSGICYKNDRQISEMHLSKSVDSANPRVEIALQEKK